MHQKHFLRFLFKSLCNKHKLLAHRYNSQTFHLIKLTLHNITIRHHKHTLPFKESFASLKAMHANTCEVGSLDCRLDGQLPKGGSSIYGRKSLFIHQSFILNRRMQKFLSQYFNFVCVILLDCRLSLTFTLLNGCI